MHGILVVNHFLNTDKFNSLHCHILQAAKEMNIDLKIKTNLDIMLEIPKADFALFWDKDTNAARLLEQSGIPVFNSAKSIELCDDKAKTYLALFDKFNQPETIIAPKTFFASDFSEFVDGAIERLGLPLVFKECFGSFGEQVFLCKTKDEILLHISEKPFILQKFIKEFSGSDLRIEVVGNKAAAAVQRFNKNDFRANVTNGGAMKKYEPTPEQKQIAINTCTALGLTFGGVDMFPDGRIIEVNSNAHIINIMNAAGVDIAPMIFEEISRRI